MHRVKNCRTVQHVNLGSAKRKNGNITPKCVEATEQKSGAIKQESIKPTVHSAVITGEHSVPVTPEADTSLQVKAKKHPRRKNFCLEPQGKCKQSIFFELICTFSCVLFMQHGFLILRVLSCIG